MLNFLLKLFVTGWPGCKHEWNQWFTVKTFVSSSATIKHVQARCCKTCGLKELHEQYV